jgi:opacity protein-like surface antigen
MKKLLLILLCLPMIGFGQVDKIIFSSGDTIYGKVIEVGVNEITYQHKGETTNNVTKKRELAKVIYTSGRIETFQGLGILESKIAIEENERLYLKQKEENKKIRIQKREDRIIYFRELNERTKNYFVIRTGISMADIRDGDDWITFKDDNTLGLSVAVDAIFSITNRIDLDASIRFSQKNIKTEINNFMFFSFHSDIYANLNKINFIDISPKLKYRIINRMHISFGPYIGYAVNLKKKSISTENPNNNPRDEFVYQTTEEIDNDTYFHSDFSYTNFGITHKINRFDYGLNIGIDYSLTKKILVSSEYSLGLSNLYSLTAGESPFSTSYLNERDYSQKTSVFYLTIGYILN